jgi:hypothetical protein
VTYNDVTYGRGSVPDTNINGLYILNLQEEKIGTDSIVTKEMDRLRDASYLKLNYIIPSSLKQDYLKLLYHNARSLNLHLNDITADHHVMAADIILIA